MSLSWLIDSGQQLLNNIDYLYEVLCQPISVWLDNSFIGSDIQYIFRSYAAYFSMSVWDLCLFGAPTVFLTFFIIRIFK